MNKYTLLDSSELLGVKVRTLREWIKLGKIKAEKIDRKWYISSYEIFKKIKERGGIEKYDN